MAQDAYVTMLFSDAYLMGIGFHSDLMGLVADYGIL